jgi:EAL domain-containing protein (putative c-di-GMP-specific phosphodiesterase class I)
MAEDPRAAAIVSSTIQLAHSLGMRLVAEGVENEIAWRELQAMGCDEAQGYFFSRPVPASAFEEWLRDWEARSAPATQGIPRPRHEHVRTTAGNAAI